MNKTFATVCSGIGAPEVAASRLGWQCHFGADIEPFPNAVRAHRFPGVPNYGDMTKYHEWPHANPDVLIAGTPCQAFSVAGLRKGMADPRGNLTLTFLGIIERYSPHWVLWENVPGVLSDKTGAFGAFLGGLAELGYGFAYRILDAQYFGVAQRRRRVFVVAHSGGQWQRAAAVLFERESLCGNPPPSRETGESLAPTISARTKGGGGLGTDFDCDGGRISTATADGFRTSEAIPIQEIGKRQSGTPMNGVGHGAAGDPMFTLQKSAVHGVAAPLAIGIDSENNASIELVGTLGHLSPSGGGHPAAVMTLAIRGRGDESNLETRQDGLANAILTPNGGRGGVGVGAVAIPEISSAVTSKWAKSSGGPSGDECQNLTIAFPGSMSGTQRASAEDLSCSIGAGNPTAIAFKPSFARGGKSSGAPSDVAHTLSHSPKQGDTSPHCITGMAVRRLTPRECERLQGFPDDFTLIPWRAHQQWAKKKGTGPGGKSFEEWLIEMTGRGVREPTTTDCPDGPRYKALGNSMAVPVIEWILRRMDLVDSTLCALAPLR